MLHDRIYLDPTDKNVYIDTYVANDRSFVRDAMLVIPGGGYSAVCTAREGEPVALAYLAKGFNCFVLHYRVVKVPYPAQLIDASRAILHIKEHAEEYCVCPERIFAVGFSAGGHLAGSLAILHNDKTVLETLGISEGENRPAGAILAYPVVSAMVPTHQGSFVHLTGGKAFEDITPAERERLSLECNVDASSAPLFIWHTAEDKMVPPCGSLALAQRYIDEGLNVMLGVYPYGPHGVALSNKITECGNSNCVQPLAEHWLDLSVEWINSL